MKKKFSIEEQFDKNLQLVGLSKYTMPKIQLSETRRAFYGAFGQMLVLMENDIPELEEDDAIAALEDMKNQVANFWLNEASRKN